MAQVTLKTILDKIWQDRNSLTAEEKAFLKTQLPDMQKNLENVRIGISPIHQNLYLHDCKDGYGIMTAYLTDVNVEKGRSARICINLHTAEKLIMLLQRYVESCKLLKEVYEVQEALRGRQYC